MTEQQKIKLEIFFIQYLPKVKDCAECYKQWAEETPENVNFLGNSEYYDEMYSELSSLQEVLHKSTIERIDGRI